MRQQALEALAPMAEQGVSPQRARQRVAQVALVQTAALESSRPWVVQQVLKTVLQMPQAWQARQLEQAEQVASGPTVERAALGLMAQPEAWVQMAVWVALWTGSASGRSSESRICSRQS